MSTNQSKQLRAKLMSFTALAGAAMLLAPQMAHAQSIEVVQGDEVEITEDFSGDPAIRFVSGGGDVVVRTGVTVTGTGAYQEFPSTGWPDYQWTDGRGAVIIDEGGGGGSLTIEEGATLIGANYGITTLNNGNTFEPDTGWEYNDFTSDATAAGNITIINHGDVIGEADDGIRVFNHATIVNTGSIIGASTLPPHESANIGFSIGDGISSAVNGVQVVENMPDDGVTLRVDNSGEIIGRRMGIIASAGGIVHNSGTIHGQSSGVLMQTSSWFGGPGVVVIPYISNTLVNSGTITADHQNGVNVQSWSRTSGEPYDLSEIDVEDYDFFDTFDYTTADAVLINSGLIETFAESGGTTTGVVVDPITGEQVPVEGASTFYAARMGSVNGYILNTEEGVIRALNGANALRLSANANNEDINLHGTIVMDNRGTIIGGVVGANIGEDEDGNEIEGPGQELIRNNGLIDGDVALGSGDDVFWLDANGTVTGTIDLGAGDDLMIWNTRGSVGGIVTGGLGSNTLALILGGTEFDAARVFNFDSVLTFGSGDLNNIDLSLVPEIQVNEGASLDIGATGFGGVAFINPGGRLVGIGEVEAIVVYGAAQIAPGNSIGTITVTGDVDFSSGTIYDVEVSPLGSDQVLAGGAVTLNGGSIVVTGEDGVDLAPGEAQDSYVVLAGAAGLTGEFASLTDNLRFYHASLTYTGTEAILELDPVGADFLAVAQTDNQAAIGDVLYGSLLGASGDLLDVMMNSFPGLDAAGVRTGMDALSGPIHAWAPVAVSELGVSIGRAAGRSPRAAAGTSVAWASGVAGSYDIDAANGAVSADADLQGGVFGVNRGLSDGVNVGVFAGYAVTDAGDAVGGRMDGDGWFFGGRVSADLPNGFSLTGAAGYLNQDIETDREIEVGALNRTAAAAYAIDGVFLDAELAWMHPMGAAYEAGVFAAFSGGDYEGESFSEAGAGSLSLSSQGADFGRASWRIGARVQGDSGWIRPRLEAGLQMEDGARAETIGLSLAGVAGGFPIRGPGVEADAPFLGVGADFSFSEAVTATIAYDGVFGDTSDSHAATARLSFRF